MRRPGQPAVRHAEDARSWWGRVPTCGGIWSRDEPDRLNILQRFTRRSSLRRRFLAAWDTGVAHRLGKSIIRGLGWDERRQPGDLVGRRLLDRMRFSGDFGRNRAG